MNKSQSEKQQILLGAVSGLTAVLAAISQLVGAGTTAHTLLVQAPWWLRWGFVAFLVVLSARWFWAGLSRKSRVGNADLLLINPDNPAHLKGRQDEIRRLKRQIRNDALVFLQGESGTGKSALLRSGLLPALRAETPAMLLLYVNYYGDDWQSGPAIQMARESWRALDEAQRAAVGVQTEEELREWLGAGSASDGATGATTSFADGDFWLHLRQVLDVQVVVVFDQFDDYLAQHRNRFLRDGSWIGANELMTENAFWAGVGGAVRRRAVHCLISARNSAAPGLECVRFIEPQNCYLEELPHSHVTGLIEELVAPGADPGPNPVIIDPDAGWNALKAQLIDDMSHQGRILPIQARTVLKGIIELDYLDIGVYQRAGRLEGLEARYIQDSIKTAAGRTGLTANAVMKILLHFVDDRNVESPKTRSASQTQLAAELELATDLSETLEVLEHNGVVRRVIDERDTSGEIHWSLYHDYLARAVLAAKRKNEYWQQYLDERQTAWERAAGWGDRWRALIAPASWLRLMSARLRGKTRLYSYRTFVAWSALRFLPYMAALLALYIGQSEIRGSMRATRLDNTASQILASIRQDNTPSGPELARLWRLATAGEPLREAFIDQLLSDAPDDSQDRTSLIPIALGSGRRAYVSRAVFGLDPTVERRRRVVRRLLERLARGLASQDTEEAYMAWLVDIHASAPEALRDQRAAIVQALEDRLRQTEDPERSASLYRALQRVDWTPPPDLVESLVARWSTPRFGVSDPKALDATTRQALLQELFSRLLATEDHDQRDSIQSQVLQLLTGLTESEDRSFVARVAEAMRGTEGDVDRLVRLGYFLRVALPDSDPETLRASHLSEADAADVADVLLTAMEATLDTAPLRQLSAALGSVLPRLPADHPARARAGDALLAAMDLTLRVEALQDLSLAFSSLGPSLPDAHARRGMDQLMTGMSQHSDYLHATLQSPLRDLAEHVSPEVAALLAERVLASMRTTYTSTALTALVELFAALAKQSGSPSRWARELVAMMAATDFGPQLIAFGKALSHVVEDLSEPAAADILEQLVQTMTSPHQLQVLDSVPAIFRQKVPTDVALALAETHTAGLESAADVTIAAGHADALAALGDKLPESHATRAVQVLAPNLPLLDTESDLKRLVALAVRAPSYDVFAPLERLKNGPEPFMAAVYVQLVLDQRTTWNADDPWLQPLARALTDTAYDGYLQTQTIRGNTADSAQRSLKVNIATRLAHVGAPLTTAIVDEVVARAGTTDDPQRLHSLARLFALLPKEHLSPGAADPLAERMVTAMQAAELSMERRYELADSLGGVEGNLSKQRSNETARRLIAELGTCSDATLFYRWARVLGEMPSVTTVDMAGALEVLKSPLAVGRSEAAILRYLGHDDLQTLLDWARENRSDLDLDAPPDNPFE